MSVQVVEIGGVGVRKLAGEAEVMTGVGRDSGVVMVSALPWLARTNSRELPRLGKSIVTYSVIAGESVDAILR